MYKLICYTRINSALVPIAYPNVIKPTLYKTYSQASAVAVTLMSKPHPACVQPSLVHTVLVDKA